MKKPWFYILLSLSGADRYGSAVQDDVRELSDGSVRLWPATLYGALEDLVEEGWIRELGADEQPAPSGGRERFYRITPAGLDALRREVERLESIARAARARLDAGGAAG